MPEKKDIFSDPKFLKECPYAKELCRINDSLNSLEKKRDSYHAQIVRNFDAIDNTMKSVGEGLNNIMQTLMAQKVGLGVGDKLKGIPEEELEKYT